jgi:hypothetical protein
MKKSSRYGPPEQLVYQRYAITFPSHAWHYNNLPPSTVQGRLSEACMLPIFILYQPDDIPLHSQIYTAAAFRESLRYIPLVSHLPKIVQADAVLTSRHFSAHLNGPNKHGDIQKVQIAIPKGSVVMLDIKALQMNRKFLFENLLLYCE